MCKKYWDVRTFGGVLGTGKNAGQVRGAVQIGMASSLDPISPTCMTITRVAYVEDKCDDKKEAKTIEDYDLIEANISEDKRRTMGTKYYIPYGLYIFHGHISPAFAEQTGFTEDDLNLFYVAITRARKEVFLTTHGGVNQWNYVNKRSCLINLDGLNPLPFQWDEVIKTNVK